MVETLVALFIFTASLLGIVALSADNIVNISYAKNKLTATYLAVEGLEYVRNARDNFILFDETWDNFILNIKEKGCVEDTNTPHADSCYVKVKTGPYTTQSQDGLSVCQNGDCDYFYVDEYGIYNHDNNGVITIFKRTIKGEESTVPGIKELKVTSEVSWEKNGKMNTVSFVDYLRNWAEPQQ